MSYSHSVGAADSHYLAHLIHQYNLHLIVTYTRHFREKSGYYYETCMKTGIPICEAFVAAADGDFATAVDLIHPVRYDIINIGGSGAQVRTPLVGTVDLLTLFSTCFDIQ